MPSCVKQPRVPANRAGSIARGWRSVATAAILYGEQRLYEFVAAWRFDPVKRFAEILATGGYVGYAPAASGTFGTLVGIPLALAIDAVAGGAPAVSAIAILACVAVAVWSADVYAKDTGTKDPSAVVSDEIVGFLFAVAFMPVTWPRLFAAFVAFRFFDILKPPPIREFEKLPGGVGIVADDLVAGIAANLVVRLVAIPLGF